MKAVPIAVAGGHASGRADLGVDGLHDRGDDGIVEVAEPEEIHRMKRPTRKRGPQEGC